jgi:hypothetical protein
MPSKNFTKTKIYQKRNFKMKISKKVTLRNFLTQQVNIVSVLGFVFYLNLILGQEYRKMR